MNPPGQSIIDALNTATLHIYMYRRDMNPPGQLIIDALNTTTPTARSRPPANQA